MHINKYTVYFYNFEEYSNEDIACVMDHLDMVNRVFHEGTVEIEDWSDEHELNQSSCDQLTFDKYFKA